MFYEFFSAFNTIQPHLLACKLMKMNVDAHTILRILDYLTNRPQFVRLASGFTTDLVYTDTGGPQGTCLSPYLLTLYTANCQDTHGKCQTADDTAQIGQITDDDDRHYLQAITDFVQWYDNNFLELNVGKTKEMIIDFRKNTTRPNPVVIKGVEVEELARTSI